MVRSILPVALFLCFQAGPGWSGEEIEVIPRSQWSEIKPDETRLASKPNGTIRYLSIHQTETPFPDPVGEVRRLRGIQDWHQSNPEGPKWGDIAYHFLIGPTGKIYEGRSLQYAAASGTIYLTQSQWEAANLNKDGQTTAAKPPGVEKPGASEGHLTISLLGTFEDELPGEQTRQNLVKFVARQLKKHNLTIDDVYFHREIACWTDCPGQELYDWFRGISREKRAKGPGLKMIEEELSKLRSLP